MHNTLKQFTQANNIPIFLFDANFHITTSTIQGKSLFLMEQLLIRLRPFLRTIESPPTILQIYPNLYCWIFRLSDQKQMIAGPIGGEYLTLQQTHAFFHALQIPLQEELLPQLTMQQQFSSFCLLLYILTGENVEEKDISHIGIEPLAPQQNDAVFYPSADMNASIDSIFPPDLEKQWLHHIYTGSPMDWQAFSDSSKFLAEQDAVSRLSYYTSPKKLEYMVVSAIALASRTAQKAGVPNHTCSSTSDYLLKQVACAEEEKDFLDIFALVDSTFTYLVQQISHTPVTHDIAVDAVCDYVSKHLYDKFTIHDMADTLGYNRTSLSRKFTGIMQVNIQNYILDERLKKARSQLLYSQKTIGQIANDLQFSSASRFCTYFKRKYEMSPLQYRQNFSTKITPKQ